MPSSRGYINTRPFGGSKTYFCVSVILKDAVGIQQSKPVQTMFFGMELRVVWQLLCVNLGFRCNVDEICALLGC